MARTTPVNTGYNIIHGTATGSDQAYVDCWLEWKILRQSISANTSTVRVVLYSACTKSSTTQWNVPEKYGYVGYDGANRHYRSTTYNFANHQVNCFGDHTFTVSHDSDGSKAITLEGAWRTAHATDISGGRAAGVVELPHIGRESTIRATDANIGSESTVTVIRQNKSFTHSIAYRFGKLSGYLDAVGNPVSAETKITEETLSFTLPEAFYHQIPNSHRGVVELTCRTYYGSTRIGQDHTCLFLAKADPQDCAPVVTGTAADCNPVTLALTGDETCLVRYMSRVRCEITVQPKNGAQITRKTVAGAQVTEDTHIIEQPQSGTVEFAAVDSRGYTTVLPVQLQLIPYVPLSVSKAELKRTAPAGDEARLVLAGKCFAGSFGETVNSITAQFSADGGAYQPIELTVDGENYSAAVELEGLDHQRSHKIQLVVSDLLGSVSKTLTLSKGVPVFDWGETDFQFHVPVTGNFRGAFDGMYIRTVRLSDANTLTVQRGTASTRQSVFLFGSANAVPVFGVAVLHADGTGIWSGTEGVSVIGTGSGFGITFPAAAYDWFTLVSAEPFSIE